MNTRLVLVNTVVSLVYRYIYFKNCNSLNYLFAYSLSHVQLFVTLCTVARQPSLFVIIFWSLLKLLPELV